MGRLVPRETSSPCLVLASVKLLTKTGNYKLGISPAVVAVVDLKATLPNHPNFNIQFAKRQNFNTDELTDCGLR